MWSFITTLISGSVPILGVIGIIFAIIGSLALGYAMGRNSANQPVIAPVNTSREETRPGEEEEDLNEAWGGPEVTKGVSTV